MRKNKFPYLIKINASFIKRLQSENRILFLFALLNLSNNNTPSSPLQKNQTTLSEFESLIKPISKANRNFIFSYFDVDQDNYLSSFFKLNKSNLPCLILYDFSNRRYAIDYSNYNSAESLKENILKIKNDLEANRLQWAHGNWLQDFLAKLGLNLTERGSLILLGCLFVFILLVLIFVMFCFGDKNDEELEAVKKKFIEQLAATKELHEEEKKLILESKNFDSLVRMGLEKIIENLKGSVLEEKKGEDDDDNHSGDGGDLNEEERKEKAIVDNLNSINEIKLEEESSFDNQNFVIKKNN